MKTAIKLYIILLLAGYSDIFAQNYDFTIQQKRLGDVISVEFWAKSNISPNIPIGKLDLRIEYSNTFLTLDTNLYELDITDTLHDDYYENLKATIPSSFSGQKGFSEAYGFSKDDAAGIDLKLIDKSKSGIIPDSNGLGSFIGRVFFRINGDIKPDTYSEINWSNIDTLKTKVFDKDSVEITDLIRFNSTDNFPLKGIKILTPKGENKVIDRKENYLAFNDSLHKFGFPIIFERSFSREQLDTSKNKTIAYLFEYFDGENWQEIGRVRESQNRINYNNPNRYLGKLAILDSFRGHSVLPLSGGRLNDTTRRERQIVFWEMSENVLERAEKIKLRASILDVNSSDSLAILPKFGESSETKLAYPMGNSFFVELNGENEYFKTEKNFSNPTQITVSAWINPDSLGSDDIGIIASSAGPGSPLINGKREGAWMLYLKDGKFPAFRARESDNKAEDGFFVNLISDEEVFTSKYLANSSTYSHNWYHISATLQNNTANLYVNGKLVDFQVGNENTQERLITTNHPIWIGVNPNSEELESFYSGLIKEVKIWRDFLSQDQIIKYAQGVINPINFNQNSLPDDRAGLDMYFKLSGTLRDFATKTPWQNGINNLNYFKNGLSDSLRYFPDIPHLKITYPYFNSGLINSSNSIYDINFIGFGIGNSINSTSDDVDIEFSMNNGSSWHYIKNAQGADITGNNAAQIEYGSAHWLPYLNQTSDTDIRSAQPYEKNILLRIKGNESFNQDVIISKTIPLRIARYMKMEKDSTTKIIIEDQGRTAIPTDGLFFSTWIRPYRFPTDREGLFPLISRADSISEKIEYKFSLTDKGTLLFESGEGRDVISIETDSSFRLLEPLKLVSDTAWTHVGFYLNKNNREFLVYIDGFLINKNNLSDTIPNDFIFPESDNYKTFIGYNPKISSNKNEYFIGNFKEIRFWDGLPLNIDISDSYDSLNLFMKKYQSIRINEYSKINESNLIAAFDFNGISKNFNRVNKSISSDIDSTFYLRFQNNPPKFIPLYPYMKLVEPKRGDTVRQNNQNLTIRWVGFDYNGTDFQEGGSNNPPSLEFSIGGGGGDEIAPYQYVGSRYWSGNNINSFTIPDSSIFKFELNDQEITFAANLNVKLADPDVFDNNIRPLIQGPIPATRNNVRLRVKSSYTVAELTEELDCESQLFTVLPANNITVRALLEAYHFGRDSILQLPENYSNGGIRLIVLEDLNGKPGEKIAELIPNEIYQDLEIENRNAGNNLFANIKFNLEGINWGNYWFILDQKNHLPVMSRFPVPIKFEGDNSYTWEIESGWDFTSWNGEPENYLPNAEIDLYSGGYYSAFGDVITDTTDPRHKETALVFSTGMDFNGRDSLPSMIYGDLIKDGIIDNNDLLQVLSKSATFSPEEDFNRDSTINAADRVIIQRNLFKISSLGDLDSLIYDQFSETFSGTLGQTQNKINTKNNYKLNNILLSGENFNLTAVPQIIGDSLELEIFIKSTGNTFTLGHSSIGFSFDTLNLNYLEYIEPEGEIFNIYGIYPEKENINFKSIEIQNSNTFLAFDQDLSLGKFIFEIKNFVPSYKFDWSENNILFNSNYEEITERGNIQKIPLAFYYNSDFIFPKGGEKFDLGQTINIQWNNESGPVYLEYAAGADPLESAWVPIFSAPFSKTVTDYDYRLRAFETPVSRFRLVDSASGAVSAVSNTFSIIHRFGVIVSPSGISPTYRAGQEIDIWFSANGYDELALEYSIDDENWEEIVSGMDPETQNYSFIAPEITTANAKFRLIGDGNVPLDTSSAVKIISGSMSFLRPSIGETLQASKKYEIQWEYQGVDRVNFELSLDDGDSWGLIQSDINLYLRTYNWDVGNYRSDRALIRAVISTEFGDLILAYSDFFTIDQPNSVEGKLKLDIISPINGFIEVQIQESDSYLLEFYNVNGGVCYSKQVYLKSGKNNINNEIKDLSSGIYIMRISNENYTTLKKMIKTW